MDIYEDERFKQLTAEIQIEQDPQRIIALTDELCRLVDELQKKKPKSD